MDEPHAEQIVRQVISDGAAKLDAASDRITMAHGFASDDLVREALEGASALSEVCLDVITRHAGDDQFSHDTLKRVADEGIRAIRDALAAVLATINTNGEA
jgi:hypothetical protein